MKFMLLGFTFFFINAALIITIIIRNQWFSVALKCKFKAETFQM